MTYPFGPHLKECCHAFPSETYALGWADSIREQKFVSKMVAECPTDTKFFLTGKHAMDLKTENLYLEGIPINRCLKMMEAKQTIILINTFSHIFYPTAYLTLSLLGNVVVTHEDYFEALDKCECYRIRAYPEMPNAIGFYIDANEKCITTIAEFFQIEDNNEHHFFVSDRDEETRLKNQIVEACVQNRRKRLNSVKTAVFLPTYKCNFACPYCFENKTGKSELMTRQMVDTIFSKYGDNLQIVGLFGGEPFLPETYDIVRYILDRAKEMRVFVITNGFHLDRFIPLLLHRKVDYVQVTLDGPKDIHDKTRIQKSGKGTFEIILENITKALQASIPIRIRMNIGLHNIRQCLELKKNIIQELNDYRNLLSFEMQPLFQIRDDKADFLEDQLFFDSEYLNSENKSKLMHNSICTTFSPLMKLSAGMKERLTPVTDGCHKNCDMFFFDSYGDIYSCVRSVGDKRFSVGTYFPKVTEKDASLLTRSIVTIPECRDCNLALICGGGCGYAVAADDGSVNHPNCSNIYKELRVVIPKIYTRMQKKDGEKIEKNL